MFNHFHTEFLEPILNISVASSVHVIQVQVQFSEHTTVVRETK